MICSWIMPSHRLAVVVSLLVSLVSSAAIPIDATPNVTARAADDCDTGYWVNALAFEMTLDEFLEHREANDLPCITEKDWASNGCSKSPDKPFGVDFHNACLRHDFSYHAFGRLCALDHNTRKMVDKVFRRDLENECAQHGWLTGLVCTATKETYYRAVRLAGRLWAPKNC